MKNIVKIPLGIFLGLCVVLTGILTVSGLWYSLPKQWHFHKVLRTVDCAEIIRSASCVISRSPTNEIYYKGSGLTNLPLSIVELKPVGVYVHSDHMVIEFHGGAEGFGLWVDDLKDAWGVHSYPIRPTDKYYVSLVIKKDPKTGEPSGPAYGSQPFRLDANRK